MNDQHEELIARYDGRKKAERDRALYEAVRSVRTAEDLLSALKAMEGLNVRERSAQGNFSEILA